MSSVTWLKARSAKNQPIFGEVMCRVLGLGSAFIYLTLLNSKRNDTFRVSEVKGDF